MPSISKIINKLIHGENSFCSLCFKTNQNIVFHDEISILIDETEQIIALSDILQSVFGKEVLEYLSNFENICEECLNLIIGIYTYIQTCHNNAMSLTQALDGLNNALNFKEENGKNKSLFISMNLSNFTSKLIYDGIKLDSTTMALKRYNLINTPIIKDASTMKKSTKSKKNETIKTSDMLLNPNDDLPRCKHCLRTYPSLNNLKTHFLRVHAPKDYKCTKCSKAYSSPGLVAYHMSVEHCEIICSECGKKFSNKASFIRHELSHQLRLVCPDCGRIYKSRITYKRHIESNVCNQECRANPANAQYTCDYCGKKYTQKMSLRVHIQYIHGNYKAHVCKWCNKKFWAQSRLKAHIVKHTKEKNFVCSICQRKFVTKESLLYHTRLHTGEKPYRCSQCNCSFISSSRRAYHMKAYHLRAMVECEICHCKFTSRSYLDKHKKTHKECRDKQNYIDKSTATGDTEIRQKKKYENVTLLGQSGKMQESSGVDENEELLRQFKSPMENYPAAEAQMHVTNERYIFIEATN